MKKVNVHSSQTESSEKVEKLKRKFNKRWLLIIPVIVVIASVAFIALRWDRQVKNSINSDGEQIADACTNILDPKCWTEAFKPQLQKVNNRTNVLIVGIDTRETGSGAGLQNTDTIMLATLDHSTKKSRLLSFPRDLYAPWGCSDNNLPYKIKINAVYYNGGVRCGKEKKLDTLKRTVEKISGEKVQYTVMIRFEGVKAAIDAIGGIEVDVQPKKGDTYTDLYPYPDLSPEEQKNCQRAKDFRDYCVFSFKKGLQQMNGEKALIYARMRKYSDDFDRGRRQQHVITAVKNKILGDDTPIAKKATNLLAVYNSLAKYITVDIDVETILAGLDLISSIDKNPIQAVLDPAFGGGGLVYSDKGNYAFRDYSFKQVQDRLKKIEENADFYIDHANIFGVNYTGKAWDKNNPLAPLNADRWLVGGINLETKANTEKKSGIEIIDFSNGAKQRTIDALKKAYGDSDQIRVIKPDDENKLVQSKNKEDIAVFVYTYPLAEVKGDDK